MIEVRLKENTQEEFDKMMRIFKKKVQNDGFIQEIKERRYFVKPSKIRHDKDVAIRREQAKNRKRKK